MGMKRKKLYLHVTVIATFVQKNNYRNAPLTKRIPPHIRGMVLKLETFGVFVKCLLQ